MLPDQAEEAPIGSLAVQVQVVTGLAPQPGPDARLLPEMQPCVADWMSVRRQQHQA
jgi:hypothetical protein